MKRGFQAFLSSVKVITLLLQNTNITKQLWETCKWLYFLLLATGILLLLMGFPETVAGLETKFFANPLIARHV